MVSAFIAAGPPSRIVEEAIDGRLKLVMPAPVMGELKRILIEKIGFDQGRWLEVEALLNDLTAEWVSAPGQPPEAVSGDPDDDLILACAVFAGVEVLVSGDHKHLLPLVSFKGVRIMTPQALLSEIRGS